MDLAHSYRLVYGVLCSAEFYPCHCTDLDNALKISNSKKELKIFLYNPEKDNWQKEFDWKVAKDARDYELDKQKTEAMAKYYANGGMRANSADRLAWEMQKYRDQQQKKLLMKF